MIENIIIKQTISRCLWVRIKPQSIKSTYNDLTLNINFKKSSIDLFITSFNTDVILKTLPLDYTNNLVILDFKDYIFHKLKGKKDSEIYTILKYGKETYHGEHNKY